jgi:hypothetical protein
MKELENELNRFKTKIESANDLIEELTLVKQRIDSSNQAIIGVRDFFDDHNKKIDSKFETYDSTMQSQLKIQLDSILKSNQSLGEVIQEQLETTQSQLGFIQSKVEDDFNKQSVHLDSNNALIMNSLSELNNYIVKTDVDYLTSLKSISEDQIRIQTDMMNYLDMKSEETKSIVSRTESELVSLITNLEASQLSRVNELESTLKGKFDIEVNHLKDSISESRKNLLEKSESLFVQNVTMIDNVSRLLSDDVKGESGTLQTLVQKSLETQIDKIDISHQQLIKEISDKSLEHLAKADFVSKVLSDEILQTRQSITKDVETTNLTLKEIIFTVKQDIENKINFVDKKNEAKQNMLSDKMQIISMDINDKHNALNDLIKDIKDESDNYSKAVERNYSKQIQLFKWISISTLTLVLIQAIYIFFFMR